MNHLLINGCFRKWWYPQIINFNRDFHISIIHFGVPLFLETPKWSILALQPIDPITFDPSTSDIWDIREVDGSHRAIPDSLRPKVQREYL